MTPLNKNHKLKCPVLWTDMLSDSWSTRTSWSQTTAREPWCELQLTMSKTDLSG